MSFIIDTFTTIRDQMVSEVEAALGIKLTPADETYIIINALAAQIYNLQQTNAQVAKTSLPWNAVGAVLEGWGRIKSLTRKAPSAATSTVTFLGKAGVTIPDGTVLVRSDGVTFTTDKITTTNNPVSITSTHTQTLLRAVLSLITSTGLSVLRV